MCSFDGEAYKVYCEVTRTARKPHKCYECGLPIPVGAKYVNSSGLLDGWSQFARHVECVRLSELIYNEYCGGGSEGMWLFGSMLEELSEYEEERVPWYSNGDSVSDAECVIQRGTGEVLHGPGHLTGAYEQIRARYAQA